jgi:His-Xaa-Ser system protein HxsD
VTYTDGAVETTIDVRAYRLGAIKKAAYRLANRCTVVVGSPGEEIVPLTFRFRTGTTEETALEAVRAFFDEVMDQELREQIAEETAPLRTLILAHAFSKVDLLRRD